MINGSYTEELVKAMEQSRAMPDYERRDFRERQRQGTED
jgi:hypothetical protein